MRKPFFLLLISGTELIKYPGISAAGASHEHLRYTAKLDAEFIIRHREEPVFDILPISPHGIVSPALITKACLNLLDAEILILDLGAHEKPNCDFISIREIPSGDITKGNAFSSEAAQQLYLQGQNFLESIAQHGFDESKHDLIIAECLVGGTTTALGLLTGLGFNCQNSISSSFPNGNHNLKKEIIEKATKRADKENHNFFTQVKQEPLLASAAFGDALQPFITGMAAAAIPKNLPLILAGGTQMLAIKTLIDLKLANLHNQNKINELISIITTPWVINDVSANFQKLKELIAKDTKVQSPDLEKLLANTNLDQEVQKLSSKFLSRKLTLQEIINNYNQGHVKEGVGLGAVLSALQK